MIEGRTLGFYLVLFPAEDVVIYLEQDQRFIGATSTPHTLYCRGEHIRTWRWSKEGRGLTNSSDGRVQILDGERLHFTELLPSDAGMYGCTVTNRVSNEYKVFRFDVFGMCECGGWGRGLHTCIIVIQWIHT